LSDTIQDNELVVGMRRRGSIILGVFGLIWAFGGSSGIEDGTARLGVQVAAVAVTALVAWFGVQASAEPSGPVDIPADWNRRYNLIGIAQGIAIGIAVFALIALGHPGLIPPVVCLIVGLHFFPLVSVFDTQFYRWTGIALCALAAFGLIVQTQTSDAATLATVGLGAAGVLWLTVAITPSVD
jgi:hypothetical protein